MSTFERGSTFGILLTATLCVVLSTTGCGASQEDQQGKAEQKLYDPAVDENPDEKDQQSAEQEAAGEDALPEDPLEPPELPRTAPGVTNVLGDNYWYLPYAIINEQQGLALVDALKETLRKGKGMPEELEVDEGKGVCGRGKLYRLKEGVTDMFICDIDNPGRYQVSQAQIPVMIAQPKPGAPGANVLFMDGHVELQHWGEFPVTEEFINALAQLDEPDFFEEEEE